VIGFRGMSDITEAYAWVLVGLAVSAIVVGLVAYRKRNA
jgi:LPXTG-motif cell wall-anchored protein